MRQRDYQRIIANYQDVMESQIARIEALKQDNEQLQAKLDNRGEEVGQLATQAISRIKSETLLFLRTLDQLYPNISGDVQLAENDYYLELARLTKPTAATMPTEELETLIRDIGGIEE